MTAVRPVVRPNATVTRIALAAGAFGFATVGTAWWGASATTSVTDQSTWGALGVAGASAVCAAAAWHSLLGRRAVTRRIQAVQTSLALASASSELPATASAAPDVDAFVATPDMARYHLRSCPLAAGKPVQAGLRREHETAGRRPCGICRA